MGVETVVITIIAIIGFLLFMLWYLLIHRDILKRNEVCGLCGGRVKKITAIINPKTFDRINLCDCCYETVGLTVEEHYYVIEYLQDLLKSIKVQDEKQDSKIIKKGKVKNA